jgi:hypothetical protein
MGVEVITTYRCDRCKNTGRTREGFYSIGISITPDKTPNTTTQFSQVETFLLCFLCNNLLRGWIREPCSRGEPLKQS